MKAHVKYFILGFILILFSAPLGRLSLNIIYCNTNLVSEYDPLLNGFIHSYLLIGIMLYVLGLVKILIEKRGK